MPHIKKIWIAGFTIEVRKTYSSRYGRKNIPRGGNINPTPEDVKKQNEKNALDNLRRLINENFSYKDIHLVLTYRRDERPDPEQAKKYLSQFIRKLRAEYKKRGLELKYIYTTEYERSAIHHHLIVNRIDVSVFADLWQFGRPHTTLLDATGDYKQLASYFIKETNRSFLDGTSPNKRRWVSSKNLKKVEPFIEIVKADSWRKNPSIKKGYVLDKDSLVNGVSEVTGYPYQFYRMVRINPRK